MFQILVHIYFVLFYLVRYRRKVVRTNLFNSFGDKDRAWILKIEKKFYRNLCDIAMESIKLLRLHPGSLLNRFEFENEQIIRNILSEGKSVFVSVGHMGNWESAIQALALKLKTPVTAIYKKPSSLVADRLMKQLRSGSSLMDVVESQSAYRSLASYSGQAKIVYIANDQTPPGLESDYWTEFLSQDTPFYTGLDKMARALGYAVVFLCPQRTGRGRYKLAFSLIAENGKDCHANEIIARYVRLLEEAIRKQPDNWLWSHRRWKHKRPPTP